MVMVAVYVSEASPDVVKLTAIGSASVVTSPAAGVQSSQSASSEMV